MTDKHENSGNPADDMSDYLQTFVDETEEQLDDLVESMLALEGNATNRQGLDEVFRLVHSIKGSAGLMGFDTMMVLTHHLENRFERFRSGKAQLDEATMNLVLRCIDFLRQGNDRLRKGESLDSPAELLAELRRLEEQTDASSTAEQTGPAGERPYTEAEETQSPTPGLTPREEISDTLLCISVRFQPGLQLADLKAQLIVARLAALGEIVSTRPDLEQLSDSEQLEEFEVRLETAENLDRLRAAADVDGVASIDFQGRSVEAETNPATALAQTDDAVEISESEVSASTIVESETLLEDHAAANESAPEPQMAAVPKAESIPKETIAASRDDAQNSEPAKPDVAETMRVDINRLDNLMNLAGELVVNRARLEQISGQMTPALRKPNMLNRIRDFSEDLRRTIETLEQNTADASGELAAVVPQLRAGLKLMEEQSHIWENGRQFFSQIGEAIDQLSRVSHGLQRGVLDTRMVPVGPLFNRFKRVVRDLSMERGKKVNLLIRGEKTELDKRMIDELGDPLVHLVRNSIDHGLEPPHVRLGCGKPETGTIILEAVHSGNNVYIHVRDDGGGIDVAKIKAKLIDNQILSAAAVAQLSGEQALDYIWHPGFSTAKEVTDVSGRGVGMDVVKTRINKLNGTIEVKSVPLQGTSFALRLPLTLAIINCLLIRLRNVTFSVPIDNLKEIVSVKEPEIVTVHGKQTIDVRGEFIHLVGIDDVFQWHGIDYGNHRAKKTRRSDLAVGTVEVVILQAGGRTLGLRVDELLGSQDIVVKSLSDNFIDISGLSGASILGDGSVGLMLDVATVIDMATRSALNWEIEEAAT